MNNYQRDLRAYRISDPYDIKLIAQYAKFSIYNEGIVSYKFPKEIRELLASLLCYKNNQYYITIDTDNSNKLRIASRKQFRKVIASINCSPKDFYMHKDIEKGVDATLGDPYNTSFSQEASLFRLLKQAIEYNPAARFLKRLAENQLIRFCEDIMKSISNGYRIEEEDIQNCYDLELRDHGVGAGRNYNTRSCMAHHRVGTFYNLFNVRGMMLKDASGEGVGRYLEWQMDNGRTYVDRLYVNGNVVQAGLKCLKDYYADRDDVEFYPAQPTGKVKIKNHNAFIELNSHRFILPYIDTFHNLSIKEDNAYLSNGSGSFNSKNIQTTNPEPQELYSCSCPICNKHFMSYKSLDIHKLMEHKIKNDNLKGKRLETQNKIFEAVKKYEEELENGKGLI